MNKKRIILIGLVVATLVLPVLLSEVKPVSASYTGPVDFSGTVTIKTSENPISGVTVKLSEDGVVKRTDTTNGSGYYSFSWTVAALKIYTIRIEKPGYRDQFTGVVPQSSICVRDFEIDGRVALFLWASDVANQTIMEELGDQLVEEEGFSDILYREDETDWEGAIDDVDALETSDSLVFIYITGHGTHELVDQNDYVSTIAHCGEDLVDTYYIWSNETADKLQCLESINIFLMIESCYSSGFYTEYKYQGHTGDDVFVMTSSFDTVSFRWYGEDGENWDPENPNEAAWGGAFTHYFFEGLDLSYNDTTSFSYAYTETNGYAKTAIPDEWTDQLPQCEDKLSTTWFV